MAEIFDLTNIKTQVGDSLVSAVFHMLAGEKRLILVVKDTLPKEIISWLQNSFPQATSIYIIPKEAKSYHGISVFLK